jgi:hypothetical protein
MKSVTTGSPSNSPWRGYYPNVNPFGNSPRYDRMTTLYNSGTSTPGNDPYDDITQSIKAIDKEDANIEAEKGEVIRHPNGVSHKVGGKKHSKGGTPLFAQGGSFIYSDDKSLSFNEKEMEKYNLGKHAKKAKDNTPAKVYTKNIDVKHKNLMNKYAMSSKDAVEQNTALRMLGKYGEKESIIAALQELKKKENELPEFAALPEKSDEVKDSETMAEQFQKGGLFLDHTQKLIDQGILSPITGNITGINDTQHAKDGIYGRGDFENIITKHSWWVDDFTKREGRAPTKDDTLDFQHSYNKWYKDQFGGDYFIEGDKLRGFDGKPGGYTSNAPIAGIQRLEPKGPQPLDVQIGEPEAIDASPIQMPQLDAPLPGHVDPYEGKLDFPSLDSILPEFDDTSYRLNIGEAGKQYLSDRRRPPILPQYNPYRMRAQTIDPTIGLSRIQANRMANIRATRQFGNAQTAAKQMADTSADRMSQEYLKGINDHNQGVTTQVHNQNIQVANNVQNQNNMLRAQHQDKLNELDQNIQDRRNRISGYATNQIGALHNDRQNFDAQVKMTKMQYPWQVQQYQNQMGQNNMQRIFETYNKLKRSNPTLFGNDKDHLILNMIGKQIQGQNENPFAEIQRNYLSLYGR